MKGHILPGLAWSITIILCTVQHTVFGQMDMWAEMGAGTTAVLDVTPVTVTAEIGHQAKLPCPITNPDGISATWFTADMVAVPADNITTFVGMEGEDAYSLIFNQVTYQHQGKYQCMLMSLPPSFKEVTLSITGPPVISRDSIKDNYSLKEGSELYVTCDTVGNPEPFIKWYVYKDPPNDKEVKELFSNDKVLRIPKISRDDAGIFGCEAYNTYGTDMFETLVSVMFQPSIKIKPGLIKKKEGENVSAVCAVTSNPRAQVDWNRIQKASKHSTYQMPENDQVTQELMLKIDNVSVSDTGVYKCVAFNKFGYTESLLTLVVAAETTTTQSTTTVSTTTTTTPTVEEIVETTIPVKITEKITNKPNKQDGVISTTSSILDEPKVGGSQQDNSASRPTHIFPFLGLLLTLSLTFLL